MMKKGYVLWLKRLLVVMDHMMNQGCVVLWSAAKLWHLSRSARMCSKKKMANWFSSPLAASVMWIFAKTMRKFVSGQSSKA